MTDIDVDRLHYHNQDKNLNRDALARKYGENNSHPFYSRSEHLKIATRGADYWKWVEFNIAGILNDDLVILTIGYDGKVETPVVDQSFAKLKQQLNDDHQRWIADFGVMYAITTICSDCQLTEKELNTKYGDKTHPIVPIREWQQSIMREEIIDGYWKWVTQVLQVMLSYIEVKFNFNLITTDGVLRDNEFKSAYNTDSQNNEHPVFTKRRWKNAVSQDEVELSFWEWAHKSTSEAREYIIRATAHSVT